MITAESGKGVLRGLSRLTFFGPFSVSQNARSSYGRICARRTDRVEVTLELPEDVFSALRRSPEEFARELRLAAAIHWYERGEVSQEKAARIAGMDRTDFLLALAGEKANAFVVDFDDLKRELERA